MHSPVDRWKRVALVLAPLLVLLAFGVVLLVSMLHRSESTATVQRTYQRLTDLHELRTRVVDAETGQRGFLITQDSSYIVPYSGASTDVQRLLAKLEQGGMADSLLAPLAQQVQARFQIMGQVLAARGESLEASRAVLMAGGGLQAMERLRATLQRVEGLEQQQLEQELAAQRAAGMRVLFTLLLGLIAVAATSALTHREFARHTRALELLNDQLQEQAVELELQSHELQMQSAALEERTEELEAINDLLEERTREAEVANVAKTAFLRTMSHELRTPLNAIEGYSALLELDIHGGLTDGQRQSVERIKQNSRHLIVLIDDVLSFARLEAGKLELHVEHMSVAQLFEQVENSVLPLLHHHGVRYRSELPDNSLNAYADPARARQILINLLSNAAKYSGPDSGVLLSAEGLAANVVIEVCDSGPGIPADMQERIFEPFVQITEYSGRSVPPSSGAGLGLAISRGLARSMGGDLTVTSDEGGARFRLILPRSIEVTVS